MFADLVAVAVRLFRELQGMFAYLVLSRGGRLFADLVAVVGVFAYLVAGAIRLSSSSGCSPMW